MPTVFDPRSLSRIAIGVAALTSLAGCIVEPAHQPPPRVVYEESYAPEPVIFEAPPPPREEVIGVAPGPGYFWIGGVWLWEGGHHVWHPGRWEHERPGYVYVPHRWVQEEHGWRHYPDHWERR